MFDALASDPSSVFMSDVIAQLNKWLGITHKVSLIDRHESNGCEATSREILRHLKCLVADERIMDNWSDDIFLYKMFIKVTVILSGCKPPNSRMLLFRVG